MKLGKRGNAAIGQLVYPNKNALKSWYREYLELLDLRIQPVSSLPRCLCR